MLDPVAASEVRKGFGRFFDSVIRENPKAVKRHNDVILALALDHIRELVKNVTFTMETQYDEEAALYVGSLKEIDLVEYAATPEELKEKMAMELVEYARQYEERFQLYFHAPNRREHFRHVLRVWLADDLDEVKALIRHAVME